jgi:hypothetical protein
MNILLWVLQVLLAAWTITGAQYMARNYEGLINPSVSDFPWYFWGIMATLEIIFALGLIVPGVFKVMPKATSLSAMGIAILFLLGSVLFIGYAGVGMLFAFIPALIALFIAYKRWPHNVEAA